MRKNLKYLVTGLAAVAISFSATAANAGSNPLDLLFGKAQISPPVANGDLVTPALRSVDQVFSRNARGLTYGSGLDAKLTGTLPDLISAYGTNGSTAVKGYVRQSDLLGPEGDTPQAAVARELNQSPTRSIPLYAQDGVTVVGTYTIDNTPSPPRK